MENKETCASKIYMHREGQQERGRKRSKGTSWREQGGKHGDRKGTRTEAGVGCLKHAIVRIIPKGPCHIYIYIYTVYIYIYIYMLHIYIYMYICICIHIYIIYINMYTYMTYIYIYIDT